MKNKLVFIFEPGTPLRVVLVNALRDMAVVVGFSSIQYLEGGMEIFPQPQIVLLPANLEAGDQTYLLWFLKDHQRRHTENITVMFFTKPFNPALVANEVEEQLAGKTGAIPRSRRFFLYDVMQNNSRVAGFLPAKRLPEAIAAAGLLLLLSPLLLFISIGILADSGGPILYKCKRAGRGYRVFTLYKFCTLAREVAGPPFVKLPEDARISAFGRWLRSNSLDELPQLWNVLKGDMSIVGNRPLPLHEAELLTTDEWALRFMAPAGITGLWQVKRRNRPGMTVTERLQLDNDYAREGTIFTNIMILALTPAAMLQTTAPPSFPEAPGNNVTVAAEQAGF